MLSLMIHNDINKEKITPKHEAALNFQNRMATRVSKEKLTVCWYEPLCTGPTVDQYLKP